MFLQLLSFVWVLTIVRGSENPYEVLGVHRSDSQATIKKAFREKALKWHPDRNKDPNASEQMVKINNAFQILSDPEKKAKYDNYGTVDEDQQKRWSAEDFFRGPGGQFSFDFQDMPFGSFYNNHNDQKKNILTDYNYKNIVIPDSYHKPFLIYVVSDICFDCLKYERLWESLCENFEAIGIGTYELNYHRNLALYREVGANRQPQFIGVVKGRKIKYKGEMSERGIRDFMATILPHNLIDSLVDNEREYFEQSFEDNKPQVLLFSRHMYPPLLYQVVAFEYQSKVKFAYVYTKDRQTTRLCKKYSVSPDQPTVLIMKEEPSSPVVVARGTALKRGTLRKLVASNLYLFVPRLSSDKLYDELCPKKYATERTLCYVLVVNKERQFSTHLWNFRENAKNQDLLKDKRAQFLYIHENVQTEFVESFNEGAKQYMVPCSDKTLPLKLLIIWRQPNDKVKYDWYDKGWCKDSKSEDLFEFVEEHSSNQAELQYEAEQVGELKDEHWHGHYWDFVKTTYGYVQHIVDSFEHPSWTNGSSLAFLFLLALLLFLGLIIPVIGEYEANDDIKKEPNLPRHTSGKISTTVLSLRKFGYETQTELLHDSLAGCITVAVLVDVIDIDGVAQSPIIQAFSDITSPYSRNNNYKFTWLSLAENLMWCNEIINSDRFGQFTPGTVIAFNGFRKYLFIYKPQLGFDEYQAQLSPGFLGFDESDDEGSQERTKLKRAALRMRQELSGWLDRLMEGTLHDKKRVDKWPQMEKPS